MTYTAPQVAEQLGVDAKTFRRFLRGNDSFRKPGTGGRYEFDDADLPGIAKTFKSWDGQRSKRTAPKSEKSSNGKSTPRKSNAEKAPETAEQRRARAEKRIDALEHSLMSRGVHISQHRD